MEEITAAYVRRLLPRRDPMGHKGTFGKVLCVCGSVGFSGAAVFAGRAAVRTGAGLVYLGVPEPVWPVAAMKCDEVMPFPLPSEEGKLSPLAEEAIRQRAGGCDAVLVGCGLGRSPGCDGLVRRLLDLPRPLVLDADGIFALAQHKDILRRTARPLVMTPHAGEFARLSGKKQMQPEELRAFAQENRCTVLYKAHRTLIAAPDGRLFRNHTGNPGMAKGGSGDVLAGITGALCAQNMQPFEAAYSAVCIHGAAGDLCAEALSQHGMLPTDLIEKLPQVFLQIEGK